MTTNQTDTATSFQILPSLLSADYCRLGTQIDALTEAGCRVLHMDIMDGHFVPNLTFGPPVLKKIADYTNLEFDVHLMVSNPDEWTEPFAFPNTRTITVHAEATPHLHRSLQKIREQGKLAGVSLNPATPLSVLDWVWDDIDLLLVMTVNPGFGAQRFIPACQSKLLQAAELIQQRTGGRVILETDGGVNADNLADLAKTGVQWMVTGNALFSQSDLSEGFRRFQQIGSQAWKS